MQASFWFLVAVLTSEASEPQNGYEKLETRNKKLPVNDCFDTARTAS